MLVRRIKPKTVLEEERTFTQAPEALYIETRTDRHSRRWQDHAGIRNLLAIEEGPLQR